MKRLASQQRLVEQQVGSGGAAIREARRLVREINENYLYHIEAGCLELLPVSSRRAWREPSVQAKERLASFQFLLITTPIVGEELDAPAKPEMIELARCTLTAIWHVAHRAAQGLLLFGVAPCFTPSIANIPVTELDELAVRWAPRIRPRWEGDTEFWDTLLSAVRAGDDRAWFELQMHAWQRLGTELLDVQRNRAAFAWPGR